MEEKINKPDELVREKIRSGVYSILHTATHIRIIQERSFVSLIRRERMKIIPLTQ